MRIWGRRRDRLEDAVSAIKDEPIDVRDEAQAAERVRARIHPDDASDAARQVGGLVGRQGQGDEGMAVAEEAC